MITTINPYTGNELKSYEELTEKQINEKLTTADKAFESWKKTSFSERSKKINKVAELLEKNKDSYALMMTEEMGKPISQSRSELEKCAWLCEHYATNAEEYLKTKHISKPILQNRMFLTNL